MEGKIRIGIVFGILAAVAVILGITAYIVIFGGGTQVVQPGNASSTSAEASNLFILPSSTLISPSSTALGNASGTAANGSSTVPGALYPGTGREFFCQLLEHRQGDCEGLPLQWG